MLVAAVLFSFMGAMVKFAIQQYGVLEIVFYRSLVGVLALFAFVRWRRDDARDTGRAHASGARRRRDRGTRVVVLRDGCAAAGHRDDAELHLADLPRGPRGRLFVARRRASRLAAGRCDRQSDSSALCLLLQPTINATQGVAATAGLVSGVLSAIAYWYVRTLGRLGEPEWRTVFYFSLSGTALGLIGSLITGFSRTRCTRTRVAARHRGDGDVGAARDDACVWLRPYAGRRESAVRRRGGGVIAGHLLFSDRMPLMGWIGILVIIGGGVLSTALVARQHGTLPAADHRSGIRS